MSHTSSTVQSASLSSYNPLQLLAMPRSPTSSEDEMARSFSDDSSGGASDTSREETIYETIRATAEPPRSHTEDAHANSLVVRVLVPDLQQTVSNRMDKLTSLVLTYGWFQYYHDPLETPAVYTET